MPHEQPPPVLCVEDTVGLVGDTAAIGVIDRSFGDVDTHQPDPQHDYSEDIQRHPDVPVAAFADFLKTGIPPRGSVLVAWQTDLKTELIPEAHLQLLDRALYVGDVVKRNADDHMSGTVIGTMAACTLFPSAHANANAADMAQAIATELTIRAVPADELLNVHEFIEGALILYGDWVGCVENVYDEITIRLSNNSVVVVEDPAEVERDDDAPADRISLGDRVKTKKGNLRRGRWRYGAFDPNVKPVGTVVEVRTAEIDVQWIARSIRSVDAAFHVDEPPVTLGRDQLESPNFYKYDASGGAADTLPLVASGLGRSYHVADVAVGDRVRFKDTAGASIKYDGTETLPTGIPRGKVTYLPRTESLGYDLNVFMVLQTQSMVTVQWQDLTVTRDTSTSLLPDPNVEDDDEVWPGEIVFSKQRQPITEALEAVVTKPAKVGVVQTVNGRDRIATVRWFKSPSIEFIASNLLRPSTTGELEQAIDNVSLYDIYTSSVLTRRRGDFVLLHQKSAAEFQAPPNVTGPDWFGEVVDLGLDGKLTVRLGAATPVVDVKVAYEHVTLAYSSDMDDVETLGSDSDVSSFYSDTFKEMWIEYEGMDGEQQAGEESDWSTEDEDDDYADEEDESMPDLTDPNELETPKTSPESKSPDKHDNPEADAPLDTTANTIDDTPMTQDASPSFPGAPTAFLVLETTVPSSHHYISTPSTASPTFIRRIAKEHRILSTSLPPEIFVRTWESRLDLFRILIIGPHDTPYEYAPFIIDVRLPSTYPASPPEAFFHSWTAGNGPVNPNLYEDGKICLSLLGTWHSEDKGEGWSSGKSTLLQVLVSILGLVLVKEPYYNEAGYDVQRGAPETKLSSALYTERAYFRARGFIVHALMHEVDGFAAELQYLYRSAEQGAPRLLDRAVDAAKAIVERSEGGEESGQRDGLRKVSLGALVMLKRQLKQLEELQTTSV